MFEIINNIRIILEALGYNVQLTEQLSNDFAQDLSDIDNETIIFLPVNAELEEGDNDNVCNDYSRKFILDIFFLVGKSIVSDDDAIQLQTKIERMEQADLVYREISKAINQDQNTLGQIYHNQTSDFVNHKETKDYQSSGKISFEFEFNL